MKLEWKSCFKVGVTILLLYVCIHFFPNVVSMLTALLGAISPIIIGCIIAYLVNILLVAYEKIYFPKSKRLEEKNRGLATYFFLSACIFLKNML